MNFTEADHALADTALPPTTGWARETAVKLWPASEVEFGRSKLVGWSRVRFDRGRFGRESLAVFTEDNREQLTVFLNGNEIFRNFVTDSDPVLGWNRPYLVPLPDRLLRDGQNELVLRVGNDAASNVSAGKILVGTQAALLPRYSRQFFWRIQAPLAANYAMLALSFAALAMWAARRSDIELVPLALSGIIWFLRDYHFYADRMPVRIDWFYWVTYISIYFAIAASLVFVVLFLKLTRQALVVKCVLWVTVLMSVTRVLTIRNGATALVADLSLVLISLTIAGLAMTEGFRKRSSLHLAMATLLLALALVSFHDVGRIPTLAWWDGLGFHVQPLVGATLFAVSLLAFGFRFIQVSSALSEMNRDLETKISTARAELALSEEARRKMEVERAIDSERARLMREMHDGIGSNLVTALAIAQRSKESPQTIATLQRALADLKITVDSLAPVDGDLVSLLANLRHRMQPDLTEAGLKTVWMVEECPALPWLDAPNALHMLRIIQEAIGNVLSHAQASELRLGCKPAPLDGRAGIRIELADNGNGFDLESEHAAGRGLLNMRTRAETIGGVFTLDAMPDRGTRITLWLPVERSRPNSSP